MLAMQSNLTLREISDTVGITERAVQKIIADLSDAGFVKRMKIGRKNEYRLNLEQKLRHPIEEHRTIGDVIKMLNRD